MRGIEYRRVSQSLENALTQVRRDVKQATLSILEHKQQFEIR